MSLRILLSEDVSPHKISLLFLIAIYCTGNIPSHEVRTVLQITMNLIENEAPLVTEDDKMVIIPGVLDLSRAIGNESRSLLLLLTSLWRINSVEALESSISAMKSLLCESNRVVVPKDDKKAGGLRKILPNSSIGLFLQKMITTFSLLHFDESLLLYEAFLNYREASLNVFISLGGEVNNVTRLKAVDKAQDTQQDLDLYKILTEKVQDQISMKDSRDQSHLQKSLELVPIPKNDLQILLDKQIHILESNGTPTPQIIREIMTLMTSPTSNTMLIQNADFNNLPSYYYIQYLEALKDRDYNGAFSSLHKYFDYMVSNNSKYFYHFALISRASLHQYFGEDEKALNAIEEAISVARENKDQSTLTYILLWFYSFMKNKPQLWYKQTFNNEQHLLEFLVNKSQLVSLPLYAMSYQFETIHIMNQGNGNITKYVELLLKATYISIHDQIATSFIKSMDLSTSVWFRIGDFNLSKLYSEISINPTQRHNVLLTDHIANKIRHAYLLYYQGFTDIAYQNLENLNILVQGDRTLSHLIQIRRLMLLVSINLKRGRPIIAEKVIQLLIETEVQEVELKMELIYLFAEVQLELGNYSEALIYLSENFHLVSEVHMIIRFYYLKCRIFIRSGTPSRAILLLLQQIQRSKQIGMLSLVVEGGLLLSTLLIKMESYSDANAILRAIMPNILTTQNQELISTAYFNLATISMKIQEGGIGGGEEEGEEDYSVGKFLKFLNIAINGFRKSMNLVMLKKSFEIEQELATIKELAELKEHAIFSLAKLKIRLTEEVKYGFIQD